MIFTASDISSLSQSLHHWELAEYVSEGLVVVACAGELLADSSWLTEERRRHLARRSTILLVAALSMALVSLIRTNELSGRVIGSLGQEAEAADRKAKKALDDSALAITQSGAAETSSNRALAESGKATTSASNALVLANGARREADSFEKDIVSAKTQASDAESHLADALQRAADAQQELAKLKTPRSLSKEQQDRIASKIKPFPGIPFDLWVSTDSDSTALMDVIDATLRSAGWKFDPTGELIEYDNRAGMIALSGISIHVAIERRSEWEPAVLALRNALISEGLRECYRGRR